MLSVLTNTGRFAFARPYDPGDFGGCVHLLEACPELREKLPLMKDHGKEWSALVNHWGELEAIYWSELADTQCSEVLSTHAGSDGGNMRNRRPQSFDNLTGSDDRSKSSSINGLRFAAEINTGSSAIEPLFGF